MNEHVMLCYGVRVFCMQVVRSIDTLVIVFIPMSVIFVMNAAIGVKICRYTRRTIDRTCSPSVAAAAAAAVDAVAAAAAAAAATASNTADDAYSNGSTIQKYQVARTSCCRTDGERTHRSNRVEDTERRWRN